MMFLSNSNQRKGTKHGNHYREMPSMRRSRNRRRSHALLNLQAVHVPRSLLRLSCHDLFSRGVQPVFRLRSSNDSYIVSNGHFCEYLRVPWMRCSRLNMGRDGTSKPCYNRANSSRHVRFERIWRLTESASYLLSMRRRSSIPTDVYG